MIRWPKPIRCFSLLTGVVLLTMVRSAAPQPQPGPSIGQSEIGGTVTGANGSEAGVWVIAETTETPTRFAKIVVTDEQGHYLRPELPSADYAVWVRGYGLDGQSQRRLCRLQGRTNGDVARAIPAGLLRQGA